MTRLDNKEQHWYCYKDEQLFYAIKNRWSERVTVRLAESDGGEIILILIIVGAIIFGLFSFFLSVMVGPFGVNLWPLIIFVVVVNPFLSYWLVRYLLHKASPIQFTAPAPKTRAQVCAKCGNSVRNSAKNAGISSVR